MKAYLARIFRRFMGSPVSEGVNSILSAPNSEWEQVGITSLLKHDGRLFVIRWFEHGSGEMKMTIEDETGNVLSFKREEPV